MKKLILGAAFALVASSAMAGSLAEPVMEETVVIEQTATSSINQHIIPPAMFILMVAGAMVLM